MCSIFNRERVFRSSELVYLSPDGESPLERIDSTKTYVVGGFVDRSVNKNQSAMRAAELNCPSVRLPIKEYYPECTHPVLNVNTVVEILIHYMDSGNWRESLQQCIPQRKVHDREQEKIEFDPMRIKTEEQLFCLPIVKLTKFEFRKALERHCIKNGLALTYHIQENNLKQMEKDGIDTTGISRYIIKACVDGKEQQLMHLGGDYIPVGCIHESLFVRRKNGYREIMAEE